MIFEDQSQNRWQWAVKIGAAIGVVVLLLMACIARDFAHNPLLPKVAAVSNDDPAPRQEMIAAVPPLTTGGGGVVGGALKTAASPPTLAGLVSKPWITSAFVVQGDPHSVADLQQHLSKLDMVFPDWYSFQSSDGKLHRTVDSRLQTTLTSSRVLIVPRLANTDAGGVWCGDAATEMLKDWDARPRLISALIQSLLQDHAAGLNVDMEALEPGDRENLLNWLSDLAAALHKKGLFLTIDVPLNDLAFDYEAIGKIADLVVVMAYDEHFPSGVPGAIAGKEWFNDGIDDMVRRISPHKLLVSLGGYGYDWNVTSRKSAVPLGFDEVMAVAARNQADAETDERTLNSTFTYDDDNGEQHKVWFLDAVTAWNQMLEVRTRGIKGMSLWRLGLEEAALWDFMSLKDPGRFDPRQLNRVTGRPVIDVEGCGELLTVTDAPREGARELTLDGRTIAYANYKQVAHFFTVKHFGHGADKQVALTFDDGPDPLWTPLILQVLKKHGVPATFFVVGDQAEHYPDIVRRTYAEGHLLGNHSFSHPNFEAISATRQRMELNITQRTIESITGHATLLFRSPFDADANPDRSTALHSLYNVSSLGYVIVGADVDSEDYARPGTARIVDNVVTRLRTSGSNIVLMHDAGGNRQQTVDALDILIPKLLADGYEFIGVEQLMETPRSTVMSPLVPAERFVTLSGYLLGWMRTGGWKVLEVLFLVATAIAIARILFVGWFAIRARNGVATSAAELSPPVAVVVPVFNEATVIRRTLEALLASDYPRLRIVVVDDGSTDETARIVADMACQHPSIQLVQRPNGGKHAALNQGFREAAEEFIVTIDGDTMVLPHTIRHLMVPFANPVVDAVCGNVQVGNVTNLLTAFQDVEYVTSQNYDRRAFESLNCISVVPGATGAWRRSSVLAAGGYSVDTLTEDADLTLTMLTAGGRIVYAPEARSITEAPESPAALYKQRFRWSFGTFQCLWKHRRQFGTGALGRVALPNMLIFQVIFPVLSPVGDLVFLWSILRGELGAVAVGYLTFVLLDLCASLVAFRLDSRPMGRLGVVLLQRLYYRQFMYVVTITAVLAALRGKRHGWNKLERHGTLLADVERDSALTPVGLVVLPEEL